MSIESDLYSFLISDGTLNKLISNRIYPLVRPQGGILPMVTYQRVATARGYNLEKDDNFLDVRIQYNIFAQTYREVKIIADRFITLLSGYRGMIGSSVIKGIFLELETDEYDSELNIPWHILDFQIVCNGN